MACASGVDVEEEMIVGRVAAVTMGVYCGADVGGEVFGAGVVQRSRVLSTWTFWRMGRNVVSICSEDM